tara:strand:- start:1054 stop:1638 length:585 start_codon:yes stop_codon:yes gene_type:complete
MVHNWDNQYTKGAHWEYGRPSNNCIKFVAMVGSGKVFDAGCGSGRDCFYLAEQGFRTYGVDISKVAIQKARTEAEKRRLNIVFTIGNLEELIYDDEKFDGIYSGYTMQSTDLEKTAKELARVLKKGKIAYIVMFEETSYEDSRINKEHMNHNFILSEFSKYFNIKEQNIDSYSEQDERGKHTHKRLILIMKKKY